MYLANNSQLLTGDARSFVAWLLAHGPLSDVLLACLTMGLFEWLRLEGPTLSLDVATCMPLLF